MMIDGTTVAAPAAPATNYHPTGRSGGRDTSESHREISVTGSNAPLPLLSVAGTIGLRSGNRRKAELVHHPAAFVFQRGRNGSHSLIQVSSLHLLLMHATWRQVFQWLEQPNELEQAAILQTRVVESRQELIHLWEEAHTRQHLDHGTLDEKLAVYEEALSEAVNSKVPLQAGVVPTQWTYTQSVFFASTVLTTIGATLITSNSLSPKSWLYNAFAIATQ
jgi:hypothetical protein